MFKKTPSLEVYLEKGGGMNPDQAHDTAIYNISMKKSHQPGVHNLK